MLLEPNNGLIEIATTGILSIGSDVTIRCNIEWRIQNGGESIGELHEEEYSDYCKLLDELSHLSQNEIRFISDPFQIKDCQGDFVIESSDVFITHASQHIDCVANTTSTVVRLKSFFVVVRRASINLSNDCLIIAEISNFALKTKDRFGPISFEINPNLRVVIDRVRPNSRDRFQNGITADEVRAPSGIIRIFRTGGPLGQNISEIEQEFFRIIDPCMVLLDLGESDYHAILSIHFYEKIDENLRFAFAFYPKWKSMPPTDEKMTIAPSEWVDFFSNCYPVIKENRMLVKYSDLRGSIDIYLSSLHTVHSDEEYLLLFMAIERLIRSSYQQTDSDKLINEETFCRLRDLLKETMHRFLKASETDNETRAKFYENLASLNRYPIKYLIHNFMITNDSDQWNISDIKDLVTLRNNIVHGLGYTLDDNFIDCLSRLKLLYLTAIFRIIGWVKILGWIM